MLIVHETDEASMANLYQLDARHNSYKRTPAARAAGSPQKAIAALTARVAQLEADLSALKTALSIAPEP